MKKLIVLIVIVSAITTVYSQSMFQSPHVFEGKTIEFVIPQSFHEVLDAAYVGGATYTLDENVSYENLEELNTGVLEIVHEPLNGESLESFRKLLIEEMSGDEGVEMQEEPVILSLRGKECLVAAFTGEDEGGYLSATEFGEYIIIFVYYSDGANLKSLPYERFKQIVGSWKIIETDKTDGFFEEEYVTNYRNDYFETELSYFDVLPGFGEDWNETEEENEHLLSEFCFKGEQGFVRIFSGGNAANYSSTVQMSKALQKVFDKSTSLTMTFNSMLENNDHEFSYYTIANGGELVGVYTTVVSDELVFFVVDKGSRPATDFIQASRAFMQEMLVVGSYDE